jgi:hypothetical protein
MAMKIEDRLVLGKLPIKPLPRAIVQQKLLANEFHVNSISGQKERLQSWQNNTFFRSTRKHAVESRLNDSLHRPDSQIQRCEHTINSTLFWDPLVPNCGKLTLI